MTPQRRRDFRTAWLYSRAMLREFRWTLGGIAASVLLGGLLYWITPHDGRRLTPLQALYGGWAALLNQSLWPPDTWYLAILNGVYPILGFLLVGEGVLRFVLLMSSRRRGEKEWMKVKASTYRDHVVLCGLGHVGFRVLEMLLDAKTPVVAIENDPQCRFLDGARATGIPILLRDMRDDDALVEAGVPDARAIVIATNSDLGNLEVALDSRRLNPRIRIVMRLFDDQIAAKFRSSGMVDQAFSASALAAPAVAAMAFAAPYLASYEIEGAVYITAEIPVEPGSAIAGRTAGEIESSHGVRVLSVRAGGKGPPAGPAPGAAVAAGDSLVVHAAGDRMGALLGAAKRGG